MMTDERFIELLSKKKSGEINLHEQKELRAMLASHPDQELVAAILEDFYTLPVYASAALPETLWQRIDACTNSNTATNEQAPAPKRSARIFGLKKFAVASILMIAIGSALFFYKYYGGPQVKQNIVSTKAGSRSGLVLPDGSQVWLNADSRISYSDGFGKSHRELSLTGEAFFDVAKDKSKPFIIRTSEMDITVLGTVFNVRAYPDEELSETALFSGSVQVRLKREKDQVIFLKPNEKLSVQKSYGTGGAAITPSIPLVSITALRKIGADSVAEEKLWTENRLAFTNEPFENVAQRVGRWFGVKIVIHNEGVKQKKFTGLFYNQNLQEVMESLKLAAGFNYTIQNDSVTIAY